MQKIKLINSFTESHGRKPVGIYSRRKAQDGGRGKIVPDMCKFPMILGEDSLCPLHISKDDDKRANPL
jgi:hypothetical protein